MGDNLQEQFDRVNVFRRKALEQFETVVADGGWYDRYVDGADFDAITRNNLVEVFRKCETPLEREFFGRVVVQFAGRYPYALIIGEGPRLNDRWRIVCRSSVRMEIQKNIEIDGRRYRVDAVAYGLNFMTDHFTFDRSPLVVELDGHTYHSDDAAFERDRQRDRHFQENGYKVRRYSSREFFANKGVVATEFAEFLFSGSGFSDGNNPFAGRRKDLKDVLGIVRAAVRETSPQDGNSGMALSLAARKADRRGR